MSEGSIPKTAPAVVHNPSDNALTLQDLPVPSPSGVEEHLIRVHAVALTNGELAWPEPSTQTYPIPGYEVAGTVISAPVESPFPPGAAIYARTGFGRQGSARPYSIALTSELGHKPKNLSWEEAATVPLSALTAWQALFTHGGFAAPGANEELNKDKRVLITAASGGVGLWAVQLARLAGVGHIVGTCGPRNVDFVKSLGAHEVLDYTKTTNLSASDGTKFDLVIDCAGGDTLEQAWTCAAEGGMVICIAMPADLKKPASGIAKNVRSLWFIVEANGQQLERITGLIESGQVRTAFDSAFPLEQYNKAFERIHGGHVQGKVVLKLN